MHASIEAAFAAALLDPQRSVPDAVAASCARRPARRFAVYRNNVTVSLIEALRRRFPVIERIVGVEFFTAMARVFVMERPPRSPLLVTYGDEFASFIAAFGPAVDLPYLPDVARLEAARTRAYHSEDVPPVAPTMLEGLAAQALAEVRMVLHPSVEIVRSAHPIVTIWGMNSGELELAPIENWTGQDALVSRPYLDVEVRALPPGGAAFLLALAAGRTLAAAIEATVEDERGFDLTTNLAGLFGAGLVRRIILPTQNRDDWP